MKLSETQNQTAIGGYFQLELPPANNHYHVDAINYQSARAAFRALLQSCRPDRVLIPKYVCDAVLSSLLDEGIEYGWYELDNTLNVPESLVLQKGDWLLYVNYYGICQAQVESLLERYNPSQLILDFSQAFYDVPKAHVLATIYSPRKFFGVPDGGVLVTSADVPLPEIKDTYSQRRVSHLLTRLCDEPENGYAEYLNAENSLQDTTPLQMSELTDRILKSVNYQKIKEKRMQNFFYLHKRLGHKNRLTINDANLVAPLCYPFLSQSSGLRERLIKNRIFIPTYWPEVTQRVAEEWIEKMVKGLLPLPIDQRYGDKEMETMATLILDYIT